MTQTENTRKPPSLPKGCNPTLVYLCGGRSNCKIHASVWEGLSRTCFVRTSIPGTRKTEKDFKDSCYAITSSSVFIFLLDNESVFDTHCLSLLGTAIAFNVPVVGVREAGYALPYEVSKLFAKTDIVDRSKPFEYKITSKNLPSVTTLASALKLLFAQSVIYHERIRHKCVREITDMLQGIRVAPVTPRRIEQNDTFFNNNNYGTESNNSNTSGSSDYNSTITPNSEVEITNWPQQEMHGRGTADISARKTPERRKPLGPSPPNKMRSTGKNSKKNIIVNGSNNNNNNNIINNNNNNNNINNKNNNNNNNCKINIHSPEVSVLGGAPSPNVGFSANNKNAPKPRSRTCIIEAATAEKGVTTSTPYHKLRRNSSLPCIKTNYMVTSEEKRSQPVIYNFPMSPRPYKRLSSSTDFNNDQDDQDSKLHLSRTCSPVDFRSDDCDFD